MHARCRYGADAHTWALHKIPQDAIRGFVAGTSLPCRPLELLTDSPDERQAASLESGLRKICNSYPHGGALLLARATALPPRTFEHPAGADDVKPRTRVHVCSQSAGVRAAVRAALPMTLPGCNKATLDRWRETAARAHSHAVARAEFKAEALARLQSEQAIEAAMREVDFNLSNGALLLLPEYGHKLRVLKRLGFVSPDDVRRRRRTLHAAALCSPRSGRLQSRCL